MSASHIIDDPSPTAAVTEPSATNTTTNTTFSDPFAYGPDVRRASDSSSYSADGSGPSPMAKRDRRLSKEWDAAKTPPSRFQKVEGSIYATPNSRDGQIARNKIHGFMDKVRELDGKK